MSATVTAASPVLPITARQRQLAAAASVLIALLLAAFLRHAVFHGRAGDAAGGTTAGALANPWLLLHLLSVVPALPLGMLVMLRSKGGRFHRLLGRSWAVLMLLAASSGLALGTHWSPIHLLSLLTLVTVPVSVRAAIRGDIASHRRGMGILFASLVLAGFFTLLPVRLLGGWLFGAG